MAETMNMASAARRGDIEPCTGKLENIIIVGSENYYNSFRVKMMFIAPGFGIAANTPMPPGWPGADRTIHIFAPR